MSDVKTRDFVLLYRDMYDVVQPTATDYRGVNGTVELLLELAGLVDERGGLVRCGYLEVKMGETGNYRARTTFKGRRFPIVNNPGNIATYFTVKGLEEL